jgi:hypothetical protein
MEMGTKPDEVLARAREVLARDAHLPATRGDIRRIEKKLDALLRKIDPDYHERARSDIMERARRAVGKKPEP